MSETQEKKEYTMAEIATHTTKDSTWLIIKDMNDGGAMREPCCYLPIRRQTVSDHHDHTAATTCQVEWEGTSRDTDTIPDGFSFFILPTP